MLTKDQATEIFEQIKKHSTADEVEAMIYGGKSALTRFANSTIHQNVAEEGYSVSVRTAFDGRTARATTNKFDSESLKRVVEASEGLAKVQHPDPDLLPMPDPGEVARDHTSRSQQILCPDRCAHSGAAVRGGEEDRARGCPVQAHDRRHLLLFGIGGGNFQFSRTERLARPDVLRSVRYDAGGRFFRMAEGEFSRRQSPRSRRSRRNLGAQSARVGQPARTHPGKYTVILEPAAVLDMAGFMFFDFGGLSILDQRSFLNNRVGTQMFGANINIWDDVAHPLQSGTPFDGEGIPRRRVQLVENGIVKRLVYARATAKKMKQSEYKDKVGPVTATGHGFSLPNEMGEAPMNIVFGTPADPKTVEQMIASTERGVLVTRLWYIREVDPYEKILTGMTRDGTFYVEDGKVRHGILNFRFNESLIHMLSNVEAMGTPVRASGEESFDMVAPPMKVRDFNFTEVTKF